MSHDEEEMSEEDLKREADKMNRIKGKMDKFMAEISMDLLDDKDFVLAKKKVITILKAKGIPQTLSYVKAFKEGFELCMGAMMEDKGFSMMLVACLNKIVSDMELDMDLKVAKSLEGKPEK